MYYDLHIHSSLSPCSDDDMTINNIVNMALIKGLDLIAITDHNSYDECKALDLVSKDKLKVLYGAELESIEEVHLLGLFDNLDNALKMNIYTKDYLIKEFNDEYYYGKQLIRDENDNVISKEPYLLIKSLDVCLKELIKVIHKYHGIAILAHIYDKRYSIHYNLGKIDKDLEFDGVEVKDNNECQRFKDEYHEFRDKLILINSDAHNLWNISEAIHDIDYDLIDKRFKLWKN